MKPRATQSSDTDSPETTLIAYAKHIDKLRLLSMLVHARCVSKSVYKEAFMHMRLFYVPVNNFSFMSERFPVFLGKTSILSSG